VPIDVEDLYRRYGPMVLRRCRQLLRDEERAVDAMQDVFVKLLRHSERLEDRGLSSLLYRTATNTCLNALRARGRRPEDPAGERIFELAAAGDRADRWDARGELQRLFRQEPPSTATIAVLHLHDGLTLEEVAEVVGMSVSGVRKRLRRVKAAAAATRAVEPNGTDDRDPIPAVRAQPSPAAGTPAARPVRGGTP